MLGQVVGVPGVGKTSILEKTVKLLENDGLSVKVVSFGSVLLDVLKEKEGLIDRDEIRKKVPKDRYIKYQIEASKIIGELRNSYDIVFVDNHFLINTTFGYHPGIHVEMENYMKTDFVVVIIADPDEILYRRLTDETRRRDKEHLWNINLHQNLTLAFATIYSHFYNSSIIVVKNKQNMLDEAVMELYEKIKSLLES